MTDPIIQIHSIKTTGDTRTVVVCPYCRKRHRHGWPMDSLDEPGHRRAHCGRGAYIITA